MLRWCRCGEAGIGDVTGEGCRRRQERFVKAEIANGRQDDRFKRGRSRLRLRWTAMVLMVEMISVA